MTGKRETLCASMSIPDFERLVRRSRDDEAAIGTDRTVVYNTCMTNERETFRASMSIPNVGYPWFGSCVLPVIFVRCGDDKAVISTDRKMCLHIRKKKPLRNICKKLFCFFTYGTSEHETLGACVSIPDFEHPV